MYCLRTAIVASPGKWPLLNDVSSLFLHQFALCFPGKKCSVRMETWGLYVFKLRRKLWMELQISSISWELSTFPPQGPVLGEVWALPGVLFSPWGWPEALFSNLDLRFHSYVQLLTRGQPDLEHEPPVSCRWPRPKPSDPPHTEMKRSWGYGPPFKGIVGGLWHKSVCSMTMWSDRPAPRYAPEWLELIAT
jgi:hypothetical protein